MFFAMFTLFSLQLVVERAEIHASLHFQLSTLRRNNSLMARETATRASGRSRGAPIFLSCFLTLRTRCAVLHCHSRKCEKWDGFYKIKRVLIGVYFPLVGVPALSFLVLNKPNQLRVAFGVDDDESNSPNRQIPTARALPWQ